jgi:hypothetical protein
MSVVLAQAPSPSSSWLASRQGCYYGLEGRNGKSPAIFPIPFPRLFTDDGFGAGVGHGGQVPDARQGWRRWQWLCQPPALQVQPPWHA